MKSIGPKEPEGGLILTCEHGGNAVPPRYRSQFRCPPAILKTHRGYDFGALPAAKALSRSLRAPLIYAETTRLLIDLNRSPGHSNLYSRWSADIDAQNHCPLRDLIHRPYWSEARKRMNSAIRSTGRAIHVSVHSFTPELRGERRDCHFGLLFDPARDSERQFVHRLRQALGAQFPRLTIKFNKPYRGTGDGLAQSLRGELPGNRYSGIELEMNQAILRRRSPRQLAEFHKRLAFALKTALSPDDLGLSGR